MRDRNAHIMLGDKEIADFDILAKMPGRYRDDVRGLNRCLDRQIFYGCSICGLFSDGGFDMF